MAGMVPTAKTTTTTAATIAATKATPIKPPKRGKKKWKKKMVANKLGIGSRFSEDGFFDDNFGPMSRLVGGSIVQKKRTWTFLTRMERVSASATVLNIHWVLTAGHVCHGARNDLSKLAVTFAERDRSTTELPEFTLIPDQIRIHPEFDPDLLNNDVCLMFFRDIVSFVKTGDSVSTACLPTDDEDVVPDGRRCFVAGWGSQDNCCKVVKFLI